MNVQIVNMYKIYLKLSIECNAFGWYYSKRYTCMYYSYLNILVSVKIFGVEQSNQCQLIVYFTGACVLAENIINLDIKRGNFHIWLRTFQLDPYDFLSYFLIRTIMKYYNEECENRAEKITNTFFRNTQDRSPVWNSQQEFNRVQALPKIVKN